MCFIAQVFDGFYVVLIGGEILLIQLPCNYALWSTVALRRVNVQSIANLLTENLK